MAIRPYLELHLKCRSRSARVTLVALLTFHHAEGLTVQQQLACSLINLEIQHRSLGLHFAHGSPLSCVATLKGVHQLAVLNLESRHGSRSSRIARQTLNALVSLIAFVSFVALLTFRDVVRRAVGKRDDHSAITVGFNASNNSPAIHQLLQLGDGVFVCVNLHLQVLDVVVVILTANERRPRNPTK